MKRERGIDVVQVEMRMKETCISGRKVHYKYGGDEKVA
jgi:hypothetical protein